MKILYIGSENHKEGTASDKEFLTSLSRLPALRSASVGTSFTPRETASEVELLCKQRGFEAVITSQPQFLERCLQRQPDYIPPPGRKQISLDNYAGSLLWLGTIPVLVIDPLQQLHTIPYGKFLTDRYISKLTQPAKWYAQTEFKWGQVTPATAEDAMAAIESSTLIAVDTETLQAEGDNLIELVCYSCLRADGSHFTYVVHINELWAYDFMRRANCSTAPKVMQHGQYDAAYFLRWNAPLNNWLYDTLTLMHCWYSELPKKLDFLATFSLRSVRYWKDDGKTGNLEDKMRYNALDGWATLNAWLSMVAEAPHYAFVNYLQEFPINFPALHAGLEGMAVDLARFRVVKAQKEAESERALERIRYLLSSPQFNPRSPPQMKELFRVLGCGHLKDTAAASVLKARAASPLNDLVLGAIKSYKEDAKLLSTYLVEEKFWHNRLFYELDPAGTDTGRAASKASFFWCGFQIQNIPRGDSIKDFLIADPGWELGEADKAQSEARCVGYLSGEQALINLVESERDYHAWNAQQFFGVPYEQIYDQATGKTLDKELRDLSKRTNHGANYNMGPDVMLDTMGPKKVAQAKSTLKLNIRRLRDVCAYLLDRYASTYPRVKGLFYETVISTIGTTNKLVSPLGWTRYFFNKPSKSNKPALNSSVAHGPQNLSVAIINREWYSIWRETVYGSLRGSVRIKAQIHDSILFQYRAGKIEYAERVKNMMRTPVTVVGADGVSRVMVIPSDLKAGATQWSKLK